MALKRSRGNAQVIETLKGIPLFAACTKSELRGIADIVKEVDFPAGQTIVKEGSSGVGMHIIVTGEIKVQIRGRTRSRLGPGSFFGEIALLDGGPRTATVIAETDVKTLSVPAWDFKSMLQSSPSLAIKMLEETCQRLRISDSSLTN